LAHGRREKEGGEPIWERGFRWIIRVQSSWKAEAVGTESNEDEVWQASHLRNLRKLVSTKISQAIKKKAQRLMIATLTDCDQKRNTGGDERREIFH